MVMEVVVVVVVVVVAVRVVVVLSLWAAGSAFGPCCALSPSHEQSRTGRHFSENLECCQRAPSPSTIDAVRTRSFAF